MSLYSDATHPASHAVRFVLAEKAINVEIHNVDGDDRPEDLVDLNPYDSVLTLVDRDLVLYEPHIIMEYLDERFPHPPLMPVDPVARANNRLYRYRIQRDIYMAAESIESNDPKRNDSGRKALKDQMTAIAPVFEQKDFFMTDEYSLVDCYLAPVLWRLSYYGIKLPSQAKGIAKYAKNLFERDSFETSLTEEEAELRVG